MGFFSTLTFSRKKYDRKPAGGKKHVRLSDIKYADRPPRRAEASYDAADDGAYLSKYYAKADSLSAASANTTAVRAKLIKRARYEYANNTYCMGMINTLANDIVGRGPRLQMLTGDAGLNQKIEADFSRWAKAVNLSAQMRTAQQAKTRDGETFALLTTNKALTRRLPVTLDLRLVEAEQVHTPDTWTLYDETKAVDGIIFDDSGNPKEYHVLKQHPGSSSWNLGEFDKVPADQIIHLFRVDRPGQRRGVPEIMPALPLYAILRCYTLATLKAAEIAAMWAAYMTTEGPANDEGSEYHGVSSSDGEEMTPQVMDTFDLEHGMVTVGPRNSKIIQVHPEHPATTYPEFKKEVIREIARCLGIPFNVAAGDSSEYNYASGRLDHQTYFRLMDIDRQNWEYVALDPILNQWVTEWFLSTGYRMPESGDLNHVWYWDGHEHVDPSKEASADDMRLKDCTLSLARYYGRRGLDWQEEIDQIGTEKKYLSRLGLSLQDVAPAPKNPADENDNQGDNNAEE